MFCWCFTVVVFRPNLGLSNRVYIHAYICMLCRNRRFRQLPTQSGPWVVLPIIGNYLNLYYFLDVVVPDEQQWHEAVANMPVGNNNVNEYNRQMSTLDHTFVVSLNRKLCHRGMFDNCEAIKSYAFLRDRFWGNKGNMCFDIRVTMAKATYGWRVRRIVENYLREKTPIHLRESIFAVVKTTKYLKMQQEKKDKETKFGEIGEGCKTEKKEKCKKCTQWKKEGKAAGPHSKECQYYKKPNSKKTKENEEAAPAAGVASGAATAAGED